MPRSLAAAGLISTNISCCNSASQRLERVSSPPPSNSTRRPEVITSGNFLPMSLFLSCTVLNSVGRRQKAFLSSCVGYLATRSGRLLIQRLAVLRDRVGEVPHHRARLGVAERVAAVVLHRHADDAARRVGLPVLALGGLLLARSEFVPPAELLQQHVVELGIAGGDVGALAVRAVAGEQVDAVALDAEIGAEVAAAVHHVLARVVQVRRAGMLAARACRSRATAGRSSRRRACSRSPCRCRPWP